MNDDLVKRLRSNGLDECDEAIARIEELEAKLDRVAQDLDNAVFAWDQHHYGGDMMEGWWVPDARSALADLKGEDE